MKEYDEHLDSSSSDSEWLFLLPPPPQWFSEKNQFLSSPFPAVASISPPSSQDLERAFTFAAARLIARWLQIDVFQFGIE